MSPLLMHSTLHPATASSAGAPAIGGAEKVKEEAKGEGTHTLYRSKASAADLMKSYRSTLDADGWTIAGSDSGGSSWGGGAGLTATKGSEYLVMRAGGEAGRTHIDLCVWPRKPDDDDC